MAETHEQCRKCKGEKKLTVRIPRNPWKQVQKCPRCKGTGTCTPGYQAQEEAREEALRNAPPVPTKDEGYGKEIDYRPIIYFQKGEFVFHHGKHYDERLEAIALIDPSYLTWVYKEASAGLSQRVRERLRQVMDEHNIPLK